MPLATDIRVEAVRFRTEPLPYRAPLKFGGRVVAGTDLLEVEVDVSTAGGRRATGRGSMPNGNVWAWPSALEPGATARAVANLAARLCRAAEGLRDFRHPLDHVHEFSRMYGNQAAATAAELRVPEPIPPLAVLLAASPLDAALHDAFGRANGINSFRGLGPEHLPHGLDHYLGAEYRDRRLDEFVLAAPAPALPLYHLVGALDPLAPGDLAAPIGDGLPETLGDWIDADGLTHLKIKLNGDDLAWDVERVAGVEAVAAAARRGGAAWRYSLDFNEKCRDAEYVLEFLRKLDERAPAAFGRVHYLEQPTHRDLRAHPENRMHAAAALKPVVIDEALVDHDSLLLAAEQGYSGVALKACKGHTEALLLGAAAACRGMFLCVQDLTCPGASFLHSAALAARVKGVAAIEGNARQYCPAGNRGWSDKYPGMFRVADGMVRTGVLTEAGLGFSPPA